MSNLSLKALTGKLNTLTRAALERSLHQCISCHHASVELCHWLYQLLQENNDMTTVLDSLHIDIPELKKALLTFIEATKQHPTSTPTLSFDTVTLIKEAWLKVSLEQNHQVIRSYHLLLALINSERLNQILSYNFPSLSLLTGQSIEDTAINLIDFSQSEGMIDQDDPTVIHQSDDVLEQYTIDLNAKAKSGEIDESIGRETEIHQVIDTLLRRRQNNPILVGEPGVGKTAIVEGLAYKITQKTVPSCLQSHRIVQLDIGLLTAGTGIKGEFEKRLKQVIAQIKSSSSPIILFIDEAHTIVGAGNQAGALDAANLLKPALARGELRTIAATTWREYKQYFEQDAALTRRFQLVKVNEPDEQTAIAILRNLQDTLQQHHNVIIDDEALVSAVRLSKRYIADRFLPDKAISLLDTACARVSLAQQTQPLLMDQKQESLRLLEKSLENVAANRPLTVDHQKRTCWTQQTKQLKREIKQSRKSWQQQRDLVQEILTANAHSPANNALIQRKIKRLTKLHATQNLVPLLVNSQTIQTVVSDWTGIPTTRVDQHSIQNLKRLQHRLEKQIKGQPIAITQITQTLTHSAAKLTDPNKPLGVFLFTGPSGVGKTHTALSVAKEIFGSTDHMSIINLSEFKESHKVSMLLGTSAGYVGFGQGGILTEAVRRQPYHLVLLDEIEKAHPSVHEIFYQLFDQGIIKDGSGREIDFTNTIIVMTSNIGSQQILANPGADMTTLNQCVQPALLSHFAPAFLGRLQCVPFVPLDRHTAEDIIQLKLNKITERVSQEHSIDINFDKNALEFVLQKSQYQLTGAREFDQIITQHILSEVANQVLHIKASSS